MANSVIVEPDKMEEDDDVRRGELGSWCLSKLTQWEDTRDMAHAKRWNQYERLIRGIWSASDKTRQSERSRYISPALGQAIESTVAEIEEAIFSTGRFFEVDADARQEDREIMVALRDMLYNDMLQADVESAISEIVLNGAIYGTGIGKIIVEVTKNKYITTKPVNGLSEVLEVAPTGEEEVVVRLVPVSPKEFCIDGSARNLTDALGMGHITIVPLHIIEQRQRDGIYNDVDVSPHTGEEEASSGDSLSYEDNGAKVYEYHGLVPLKLLTEEILGEDFEGIDEDIDEEELVEAIVTMTEGGDVLRAITNPNTLQDRNFIAFQFETLPAKFWGRGVAEKGYNPQMALDAEERARIDGMALAIHPMLAVDAGAMPRGTDTSVRAGKTIFTSGKPSDIVMPMNFGTLGTDTFRQSGELERQLVKATGAFDDNSQNISGAKTGAMGMAISGVIKRSKRTLKNVERSLITPMVHKFAWRYMQFAPEKYPLVEKPMFKVVTSNGIIAKEWETTQQANMIKTTTPDNPAYWMLMKGIYQNSSIKNKEQFETLIDAQIEKTMNPQPDPVQQANLEAQQAKIKIDMARARAELLRIEMDAQKLGDERFKLETEAILNIARAESEEAGRNMAEYTAILNRIKAQTEIGIKRREQEKMAQAQAQASPPQPVPQ